jgi:two-component system, response regulator
VKISEPEVILVEDSQTDAELTIRALKKYNLANRLVRLKDGAEAIDFIFAQGQYADRSVNNIPKLILLDLKLPKVDGLKVLERIRNDPRTKNIPVVMLTSSHEERDLVASYKLGVNSYIVKPVEFEKFVEAVQEIGYYWLLLNQPLR